MTIKTRDLTITFQDTGHNVVVPILNENEYDVLIEEFVPHKTRKAGYKSTFTIQVKETNEFCTFDSEVVNNIYRHEVSRYENGNVDIVLPVKSALGGNIYDDTIFDDYNMFFAVEVSRDYFILLRRNSVFAPLDKTPVVYRGENGIRTGFISLDAPKIEFYYLGLETLDFTNTADNVISSLKPIPDADITNIDGMTKYGAKIFKDISTMDSAITKLYSDRLNKEMADFLALTEQKVRDVKEHKKIDTDFVNTLKYGEFNWAQNHFSMWLNLPR